MAQRHLHLSPQVFRALFILWSGVTLGPPSLPRHDSFFSLSIRRLETRDSPLRYPHFYHERHVMVVEDFVSYLLGWFFLFYPPAEARISAGYTRTVKQQGKGKRKVWRMWRKEKDKKIQGESGRVVHGVL